MDVLTLNNITWPRRKWLWFAVIISMLFVMCLWSSGALAYVGLGGFQSEKMIGNAGTGASSLVISQDGSGAPLLAGMGPRVTTGAATNVTFSGSTSATLNGNITSLNGAPAAEVFFKWGYDANCSGGTTTSTTFNAPGAHTATITGFDPARTVYFQLVGNTDGTARGSVSSFIGSGGSFGGYSLLWWGVLLAIIGGLAIYVLKQDAPLAMAGGVIAGLVAYYLAYLFMQALW